MGGGGGEGIILRFAHPFSKPLNSHPPFQKSAYGPGQHLVIVKNGLFSPVSEHNLKENDNKSSGSDIVKLIAALLWRLEEE